MKLSRTSIHLFVWLAFTLSAFLIMITTLEPLQALLRTAEVLLLVAVIHYVNTFIFGITVPKSRLWQYVVFSFLSVGALASARYFIDFRPLPIQSMLFPDAPPNVHWGFFLLSTGSVYLLSSVLLFLIKIGENERRLLREIHAGNEAKLQYLDAQIKPHFLFNALNNVYSLVLTRSEKAPEMLLALTSMLRYSIYQKPLEKIPVSEEAAQIGRLINLFSLKSDEAYNIRFTINIGGGTIEPMILVPLAENSLKHCDFDLNPEAFVTISIQSDAKRLLYTSENSYAPKKRDSDGGVGLKNIRERLELLYGKHFSLEINDAGLVYKVKLEITWTN